MAILHSIVSNEETSVLTAIINGNVYIAEKTHASFNDLVAAVTTADESTDLDALARMFEPAVAITNFFTHLSERVTVAGGHVYFDGEELRDELANSIIRFINENENEKAQAYVNFLEKVKTNPNEHSREQLFDWLVRRDFTITESGNFIAYKGVRPRGSGYGVDPDELTDVDKYPYESISSGTATVDGQVYQGAIPNGVGAVVEMPRGEVQHDPSVGCHTGLHAGTWEYASTFGRGATLTVEVNPRDVVSVPTDSDWQKIRTCRYTVKEVVEQQFPGSFYPSEAAPAPLDEDYSPEAPFEGDEDESWV